MKFFSQKCLFSFEKEQINLSVLIYKEGLLKKYYRKSLKYKKICLPLQPLLAKQMFNLFINQ